LFKPYVSFFNGTTLLHNAKSHIGIFIIIPIWDIFIYRIKVFTHFGDEMGKMNNFSNISENNN